MQEDQLMEQVKVKALRDGKIKILTTRCVL